MSLIFRIERAKKLPRIAVLREKKEGDKRDIPEQLGTFNEQKSVDHITSQLTQEELYEFQNFLSTLKFSKDYFDTSVDHLDRFIFKVPAQFKEALKAISIEAKNYNLDFIPDYEMLVSLLNRAKIVEQQLKVLTNNQFSVLSAQNIDLIEPSQPSKSLSENQKLMKALFNSGLSFEELAEKFNKIAENHEKRAKFAAHQFEIIQDNLINRDKETFPKWYYAVAIEIIKSLGINLSTIISPASIVLHWLRLYKQETFEATIKKFKTQFKEFTNNEICQSLIKKAFIDDELIAMGKFPQNTNPTPSVAVQKWLTYYKKSQTHNDVNEAIAAFKKSHPISGEHAYFIELINELFKVT